MNVRTLRTADHMVLVVQASDATWRLRERKQERDRERERGRARESDTSGAVAYLTTERY